MNVMIRLKELERQEVNRRKCASFMLVFSKLA